MGRITDNRADIYQEITDQMIAMIEAGTRPWSKSWNGSTAPNIPLRSTGVPYRGINVLTLWVAAMTKGYASPHWLTFKQALALGGWPLCIIRTQIHGSDDDRLGFRRRSIGMAVAPEYIREPHRQHPAIPITKRPARWPAIVLGEDA
jgi:hypothetical protein